MKSMVFLLMFVNWFSVESIFHMHYKKSIEELKSIVEDFSQAMDSQLISEVCRSARTRFEMLQLEKGGRFEHKKEV